jgi:hypothetical protein
MLPGMGVIGAAAAPTHSKFTHGKIGSAIVWPHEDTLFYVKDLLPVMIDAGFDVFATAD